MVGNISMACGSSYHNGHDPEDGNGGVTGPVKSGATAWVLCGFDGLDTSVLVCVQELLGLDHAPTRHLGWVIAYI